MSTTKHTPGPWVNNGHYIEGSGYMVCRPPAAKYEGGKMWVANGDLIAAAPELLAALREFVGAAQIGAVPQKDSIIMRLGIAAIAKADPPTSTHWTND